MSVTMEMRLFRFLPLLFAGQVSLAWGAAASADYSGAEVYAQHCARCHTNSVGGAPRPGNDQDWSERASGGRANLLLSVLKGKGGMPPKGGNASLSVGEANAALDFMMAPVSRR